MSQTLISTPDDRRRAAEAAPVDRPRVLVLGGGAVVRECFAPALGALGLLDDTTIVDPHASAATFRQSVNVVNEDYRQLLDRASADGRTHCVIALPNALHFEATDRALKAGLHVLCEKPLSLNAGECARLADLADRSHRTLAVNLVRRRYHSLQAARDALSRGWIGDLLSVEIAHGGRYGWPAASIAPFQRENGGVLADMGVHYLDLVEMFVGPVEPVAYEDDWAGGVESDCTFRLRTSAGLPVTIAVSRTRPLVNEISLVGTRGRIRIGVDEFHACHLEVESAGTTRSLRLGLETGDGWHFEDYFTEQVRHFIAGGPDAGLVDGHAAARAAALIEWAYGHRPAPATSIGTAALERGKVLVTGATGFIGSHLVERLTADGRSEITAGYNSVRTCARISRFPVNFQAVDLLNPSRVKEAVHGQRYVFHLAVGKTEGQERAITVQGTKNIVEAAIAEGVEAVVILSTMYVIGRPGGTVDETADYRPIGGLYGTTKTEMERWCLERAKTSPRTRIVVLLPTCVYGEHASTYTEMPVDMARERRFCWIADGRGVANVIYVGNLVDSMVRAAITPEAHGERFIVNDDILTWREFLTPLLGPLAAAVTSPTDEEFQAWVAPRPGASAREVIGSVLRSPEVWATVSRTGVANRLRPVIKKHLPAVSRMKARASTSARTPAAPDVPQPPAWLSEVFGPADTRFSSDKARRVLGWTPRLSTSQALAKTSAWLREQGAYGGE